ncbi:MAG: ATP-binding protein [Methanosarcinales archaeon]|nr:ATP-binding protein [Methanosarcinales archaeon]
MRRIEFHNRAEEKKEIKSLLETEPTLITFIYGPINSGKTELINHVIEELPEEYVVFYINLRTKFLVSYDDFIESLFEMEMESEGMKRKGKETLTELVSSVTKVAGIPINKEFLDYVFKDNKPKNASSYIIKLFEEVKVTGKQPVLILDELQKIGDVKVNGKDVESESKKLLKIRTSRMLSIFDDISLGEVKYSEKNIIKEFRNFEQEEILLYDRINKEKIFLVGRNVLFIDPTQRTIKPQSRLNLLAIREVIKDV